MGAYLLKKIGINEDELFQILSYFKSYFKNPVQAVRFLPTWNWPTILVLTGLFAALSGTLSGIYSMSISQTIVGLIFFPISVSIGHAIISGFFYYSLFFFFKVQVSFQKLFTLILLTSLPTLALNIFSNQIPAINLVGLLVSGFLITVGLVDNFRLKKNSVLKLVFGIYIFFFLTWVGTMISTEQKIKRDIHSIQPESLDILEKELNQ